MKTITAPTLSKITPTEPMLEHAIRLRAYELYAQRGMTEGHAVHDWLAAEAELLHGRDTTATDLNQKVYPPMAAAAEDVADADHKARTIKHSVRQINIA
jgi:hypothetical protein